tara:strand:+ start:105 stop:326 length:222 start_codon:yes stop_codon:yes gene_type:complete
MKKVQSLFAFVFMFVADYVYACSTCYGDPNSNAGKGMDMAIFTLLGVIGPLLFAILIGIVSIGLKSKRINQVK